MTDIVDAEVVEESQLALPPSENQSPWAGDATLMNLLGDVGPGDITNLPGMKLMIFGEPGGGKSTLAATAPRPWYCDADVKPISIPHIFKSEGYVRYRNLKRLEAFSLYAAAGHPYFDNFDTIVIDPISLIRQTALAEVAEREYKKNPNDPKRPNKFTIIGGFGGDYGEVNERLRQLVDNFRKSQKNLILLSHTRYSKEAGGDGPTTYGPDMSDALNNLISGMMDVVGYLKQEVDVKHNVAAVLTIRSGAHKTKASMRSLPNTMMNPTWPKLYKHYFEHINSAEVQA